MTKNEINKSKISIESMVSLDRKKPDVKYVVAKKSQRGVSRPSGGKGPYKVVDKRLKKDKRAAKRLGKNNKNKKPTGRGNKQRRAPSSDSGKSSKQQQRRPTQTKGNRNKRT